MRPAVRLGVRRGVRRPAAAVAVAPRDERVARHRDGPVVDEVRGLDDMASRASGQGRGPAGEVDVGLCPGRHQDLHHEGGPFDAPARLRAPVGGEVRGPCPGERATGGRRHPDAAPAWFGRRESGDGPVEPVGDGAEGVVVEGRHLPGIDGAVGKHRVPALPHGGRPHGHGVQPGGAVLFRDHAMGETGMTCQGQGVADQGVPAKPVAMRKPARRTSCARRSPARSRCRSPGSSPKHSASA